MELKKLVQAQMRFRGLKRGGGGGSSIRQKRKGDSVQVKCGVELLV